MFLTCSRTLYDVYDIFLSTYAITEENAPSSTICVVYEASVQLSNLLGACSLNLLISLSEHSLVACRICTDIVHVICFDRLSVLHCEMPVS